jgi:hypothetical protein
MHFGRIGIAIRRNPTQANEPAAQKRASAAPSPHSNARFTEECQSIPSNMIALLLAR